MKQAVTILCLAWLMTACALYRANTIEGNPDMWRDIVKELPPSAPTPSSPKEKSP